MKRQYGQCLVIRGAAARMLQVLTIPGSNKQVNAEVEVKLPEVADPVASKQSDSGGLLGLIRENKPECSG